MYVCISVCIMGENTLISFGCMSPHSQLVRSTQLSEEGSIHSKQVILPLIMELTEMIHEKINIFHLSYLWDPLNYEWKEAYT